MLNSKSNKYLRGRDNPILHTIFKEINMKRERKRKIKKERDTGREEKKTYIYGHIDRQTDRKISRE